MEEHSSETTGSRRMTVLVLALAFIIGLLLGLIFHDSFVRPPVPDTDIHRWYPR
jgi:hypothetical protein